MKKMFVFASFVGITAGISFWLYKKGKANQDFPKSAETAPKNSESVPKMDKTDMEFTLTEKKDQEHSKCVQTVSARHSAAGEIMKEAYRNIMEDFSSDKSGSTTDESHEIPVDNADISVIEEQNSISDELNDLLK